MALELNRKMWFTYEERDVKAIKRDFSRALHHVMVDLTINICHWKHFRQLANCYKQHVCHGTAGRMLTKARCVHFGSKFFYLFSLACCVCLFSHSQYILLLFNPKKNRFEPGWNTSGHSSFVFIALPLLNARSPRNELFSKWMRANARFLN